MLKLYNSLTKQKEDFDLPKSKEILMYDCGPTVYGKPHIGNLSRYIMSDILRRYLEYKGYKVKQVMNITDVGHLTADDLESSDEGEDKIIAKAKKEGKDPLVIARYYEKEFFKAAKKLNLKIAEAYDIEKGEIKNTKNTIISRATDEKNIGKMKEIIQDLIGKDYAYETSKGIYYNVSKFKNYGKLSGNTLDKLQEGKRVKVDPEKKTPYDFALWIKAPKDHLMQWDSPWGKGYPGWHIECPAIVMNNLGKQIDIHTGGEDNIFPHHEDEIAEAEAYTGKSPFVKFWLHKRHFVLDGDKMSKSKGNVYTLEDLEKMGYSPEVFKSAILSGKYNSKMNFSEISLEQAKGIIEDTRAAIQADEAGFKPEGYDQPNMDEFKKAMDNDLNTPEAIATVRQLGTQKYLTEVDEILGTNLANPSKTKIPTEIKKLADKREKARKEKNFTESDRIRGEIEKMGFEIEDTKEGYAIKKKS